MTTSKPQLTDQDRTEMATNRTVGNFLERQINLTRNPQPRSEYAQNPVEAERIAGVLAELQTNLTAALGEERMKKPNNIPDQGTIGTLIEEHVEGRIDSETLAKRIRAIIDQPIGPEQ